jgi:hypothetical protein
MHGSEQLPHGGRTNAGKPCDVPRSERLEGRAIHRIVALKLVNVLAVLWTWVALSESSGLYAQTRARAPERPSATMGIGAQDPPGFQETRGANPCPRWSVEPQDPGIKLWKTAWTTICIEKVRSDAVALAWARGLDERAVPLDLEARARKLVEMELWLRRLVGKSRIAGERWSTGRRNLQVRGTADCFGIGDGPGVSCVISAVWKDSGKAALFAIRPQILLFGLDPGAMEIRVTHVDVVAVEMRGFLLDGAVILEERSSPEVYALNRAAVDPSMSSSGRYAPGSPNHFTSIPLSRIAPDSTRQSRVAIKPDGDIDMKFYVISFSPRGVASLWNQPVEFDLQLHRESRVDTVGAGNAP